MVSEKPGGLYQVILGNQAFTVNRKTVTQQYDQSLRPASSNNELIPLLEDAFNHYLLTNYKQNTREIVLKDKNNQEFKFSANNPFAPFTATNEKLNYQLLNQEHPTGYVFAFLNNIPFNHVKNADFFGYSPAELKGYFDKKNVVNFFSIQDKPIATMQKMKETQLLNSYNLEKNQSYQVVTMDQNNLADQNLLQEYNEKLTTKGQPPITNFHNLYRFINPRNTTTYSPEHKGTSKIFNDQMLADALMASAFSIHQVPTEEPPTLCALLRNLFKKPQSKNSSVEN